MSNKEITLVEFYEAIKLIADYKLQLEEVNRNILDINVVKIDISKGLKPQQFKALSHYYNDIYNIELVKEDLIAMDINYLKSIDYSQLKRYRGFGAIAEIKFRELMKLYSVL